MTTSEATLNLQVGVETEIILEAQDADNDPITYVYVGSLAEGEYTLDSGSKSLIFSLVAV